MALDEPMSFRDNVLVLAVGVVCAGGFVALINVVGALLMLTVGKI